MIVIILSIAVLLAIIGWVLSGHKKEDEELIKDILVCGFSLDINLHDGYVVQVVRPENNSVVHAEFGNDSLNNALNNAANYCRKYRPPVGY
jgi:hypothetical protein